MKDLFEFYGEYYDLLYEDKDTLREFQDLTKYKNTIFANGVDLFYEIFELEKKIPRSISNLIFSTLKRNKYITSISSRLANEGF